MEKIGLIKVNYWQHFRQTYLETPKMLMGLADVAFGHSFFYWGYAGISHSLILFLQP